VTISVGTTKGGPFHLIAKNAFKLEAQSGDFEEIAPPD